VIETTSIHWAQLSRFHLRTEKESRSRNIVPYIKDRTKDNIGNCKEIMGFVDMLANRAVMSCTVLSVCKE
jgi:hypothetical protein